MYTNEKSFMKKISIWLLFLVCGFTVNAQTENEAIVQSLKAANIEVLAQYFDDFIDLKLLDKDEVKNMSKNQATIALKSFYNENGIIGFDKVSEGGKGTLAYLIGKLTTANKSYNITIQLKQKNGKSQIITIRIS
jgi:hypothetical protein